MNAPSQTETAILALALQAPDLAHHIDALGPEHFQDAKNRTVFTAWKKRRTGDAALLADELAGRVDSAYLASLRFFQAESAHLDAYLAELRSAKRRRDYLQTLRELTREAESGAEGIDDLMAQHEARLLKLTREASDYSESTQAERIAEAFDHINAAYERRTGLMGIDTGLAALNDLYGGWVAGTYNIILGVPGAGKTALWLQSALQVARADSPVAMVQLEMTETQLSLRQIANSASVALDRIQRGQLSDRDFERLADSAGGLSSLPHEIFMLDGAVERWDDIARWFRRKHADEGCKTLWIDNLKLVEGLHGQSELERFQYVSRSCKKLTRELNVAIIAIHHVTKIPESRDIEVNDAYGSSAFRQDADNILLMNLDRDDECRIWLESGKARNGIRGAKRPVIFNGALQRFEPERPGPERPPAGAYDKEF